MKIIISPSKTMNLSYNINNGIKPTFNQKHLQIRNLLINKSKDELKEIYSISDKMVDKVYDYYHNKYLSNQAIFTYSGFVYKELELETYTEENFLYLNNHLYILSAMYGILKSNSLIKPYRLDYLVKFDINLTNYWKKDINEFLKDDILINLASNEFAKIIDKSMINIHFKDRINNGLVTKSTNAKKARGAFLNEMIKKNIESLDKLKCIIVYNYVFNKELSNEYNLFFINDNDF